MDNNPQSFGSQDATVNVQRDFREAFDYGEAPEEIRQWALTQQEQQWQPSTPTSSASHVWIPPNQSQPLQYSQPHSYTQWQPSILSSSASHVWIPPNQSQPLQYSQPHSYTQGQPSILTSSASHVWIPPNQSQPLQYSQPHSYTQWQPSILSSSASHVWIPPNQSQPLQYSQPHSYTQGQPSILTSSASHVWIPPNQSQPLQYSQPHSYTAVNVPSGAQQSSSDWQEYKIDEQPRYYHNKKTSQSTREKPLELMNPIERADASTEWRELITLDGQKYYFNLVTRNSQWRIPEELKAAREQAEREAYLQAQARADASTVWREFITQDGQKYYHNLVTKNSEWDNPEVLKEAREQAAFREANLWAQARADASTEWGEFCAPDGKKYYFNMRTNTSHWRIPKERSANHGTQAASIKVSSPEQSFSIFSPVPDTHLLL